MNIKYDKDWSKGTKFLVYQIVTLKNNVVSSENVGSLRLKFLGLI